MASADHIVKFNRGDYVMREGEDSTQMYYIQSGTLAVFKRKGDQDVQIGTIYSGEIVGEMSFLDKAPRCATVKAIADCELVEIHREKFEALFNAQPTWYRALIHTLLDRLRKANARIRV